jgi:transcriptional regulator with XRE-family HTH domain
VALPILQKSARMRPGAAGLVVEHDDGRFLVELARRLGLSRNTARRYLRSEITEPSYAERRASSALDKYSLQLSGWLKAEMVKPRKQRRNLKQVHEDLQELGYDGS